MKQETLDQFLARGFKITESTITETIKEVKTLAPQKSNVKPLEVSLVDAPLYTISVQNMIVEAELTWAQLIQTIEATIEAINANEKMDEEKNSIHVDLDVMAQKGLEAFNQAKEKVQTLQNDFDPEPAKKALKTAKKASAVAAKMGLRFLKELKEEVENHDA